MEKWLTERGYSEKFVRKDILKARALTRETLFDKEKVLKHDDRVTFNITRYPNFKNIRNVFKELQNLLAPDEQHKLGFADFLE